MDPAAMAIIASAVVVFVIVLLLRILPLIHKPIVTLRVPSKPFQSATGPGILGFQHGQSTATYGPTQSIHATADQTELSQAKSQWERLVQEAESNDQLTPEQRQTFVGEARKRIEEINKQLEGADRP